MHIDNEHKIILSACTEPEDSPEVVAEKINVLLEEETDPQAADILRESARIVLGLSFKEFEGLKSGDNEDDF